MSYLPLVKVDLRTNTARVTSPFIPTIHAHHPDGALDLAQRLRLTAILLAARWAGRQRKSRRMSGLQTEFDNPRLWKAVEVPRGLLSDHAWALAVEHQPAWVINHGLRTHAWAQAFGVIGGLSADREALFAAAMLHDAGLTPVAATPPGHCFAIRGARYARQTLGRVTDPKTLDVVAQAIARHLDFQVNVFDGVEAHLLQAGAMADVLGRSVARVPRTVRERVLSAHPRLGMKEELCRCMVRESAAAPHSRVACYVKQIDFLGLIRQAPFDE